MCEVETEIVLTYLFIIIFIYWRITADPTEELLAAQVKLSGRGPARLSTSGLETELFLRSQVPDKGLKPLNWGYTTEPSITPGVL
jgi:hypothetical protein